MKDLKRMLLATAMMGIVSFGAFAQKDRNDNRRPPKQDPPKVVVKDKDKPPPSNNNRRDNRGDRRGKP